MTGGFQYTTGILGVLASVNVVAQSAAIAATTFFTVPSVPASNPVGSTFYRVSWAFKVTQVATTSISLGPFQIRFTSEDDVVVVTDPNNQIQNYTNTTNNTLGGGFIGGVLIINPAPGSVVQFIMGYTSVGLQPMIYSGHVKIELVT